MHVTTLFVYDNRSDNLFWVTLVFIVLTFITATLRSKIDSIEKSGMHQSLLGCKFKAFVWMFLCCSTYLLVLFGSSKIVLGQSMRDEAYYYSQSGFVVLSSAILSFLLFRAVKRCRGCSHSEFKNSSNDL
jgi:phosphatidylglycerophosphate synthase